MHGLSGSCDTTWSVGKGDDSAIWLRDRLPKLLAKIDVQPRIRTFGYDARFAFTRAKSTLETSAIDLLTRIRIMLMDNEDQDRPIIFIAHSMGGLLVKLAINLAHTDNVHYADVLTNTKGCVFLAVPFHGADDAFWAEKFSRIIKFATMGIYGNLDISAVTKRNSKDWMNISRDFVQRGKDMVFWSAYETVKMSNHLVLRVPHPDSSLLLILSFRSLMNLLCETTYQTRKSFPYLGRTIGPSASSAMARIKGSRPSRSPCWKLSRERCSKVGKVATQDIFLRPKKGLVLQNSIRYSGQPRSL